VHWVRLPNHVPNLPGADLDVSTAMRLNERLSGRLLPPYHT